MITSVLTSTFDNCDDEVTDTLCVVRASALGSVDVVGSVGDVEFGGVEGFVGVTGGENVASFADGVYSK